LEGYAGSHGGGHDSQHEMRVRSFIFALKRHKKYLPAKNSSLLDIGTAGGAFLEAANIFGYKTFGIEPSIDLVNRGKARGLNIYHGSIENNELQDKKFDIICFWDVLEHVANPREVLRHAINLLSEDGVLLINFPNIGTMQARLAGKRFWWIISVHLVHFTNNTLDKLCLMEGLIPVRKKRYWQILELGYLVELAGKLGVPLISNWVKLLPKFIEKFPFVYYASQTTAIYKKNL
jgi:SAM-dependent methyltransferase